MKGRVVVFAIAAAAFAGGASAAKIYQWTDEQGRVQYSDRPPPINTPSQEKRVFSGSPDETPGYVVRRASEDFPVTLYTSADCGTLCDNARNLLKARGIPFSEKVLATEDDGKAFEGVFGSSPQVPAATVGRQQLKGFSASSWNSLLDLAGYPKVLTPARSRDSSSN